MSSNNQSFRSISICIRKTIKFWTLSLSVVHRTFFISTLVAVEYFSSSKKSNQLHQQIIHLSHLHLLFLLTLTLLFIFLLLGVDVKMRINLWNPYLEKMSGFT